MRPIFVHGVGPTVRPAPRSRARAGPVAVAASTAGIAMLVLSEYPSGAALLLLAAALLLYSRLADAYNRPGGSPHDYGGQPVNPVTSLTTLGSALVTLQGVILTLLFALLGEDPATLVVKLGSASLASGILVGLTLLLAISFGASTHERIRIAFDLLLWSTYACALGILCIACAVVAER